MKLKISEYLQDEMDGPVAEALGRRDETTDPSDAVYIKIGDAANKRAKPGPVTIEADERDVAELTSRIENEIASWGICSENLGNCYELSERAYWMGRKRAYTALKKQIDGQRQAPQ